mgnify:FL=1|jgi:hypothetical protein
MDIKKLIKTGKKISKVIPFVTAVFGVATLALTKYEEKLGNYSREFSEVEDEMKAKIEEVKKG